MHSLQVGKLCTRDTLAPTGVRFSVYFLLYVVARDQAGLLALCDASSWLEDASSGVALADVSRTLVVVVAAEKIGGGGGKEWWWCGGNDCAVVVDSNISGRGLKMLAKTEGFCWGMQDVWGDL